MRERLKGALEERIALMAPARRLRLAVVLDALEGVGRSDRQLRLLDAGCGDGLLTLSIARRHPNWSIVGYDVRDDLLSGARRRARARGLDNVTFEQADLVKPFAETGFDVVLAIECLSEIPDDALALTRMSEALAPGGSLLAHVPEQSWRPILRGSAPTWREEVRHGYSREEIAIALQRAGLDVVEVTPTLNGTVTAAQELRDRIKAAPLAVRALAYPAMLAAVRLERWGVTWGRGQALLAVARRAQPT